MRQSPVQYWLTRRWLNSTAERLHSPLTHAGRIKPFDMRPLAPLLILALLPACAVKTDASHQLSGSQWRFVAIDDRAPVSDSGVLNFEDGELSATIGCNHMGGNWRIEGDRLIAGPLETTEMGCIDAATFDQERALASLLVAAPLMDFGDGRMVLRSSGHSAELHQIDSGVSPRQPNS